MHIQTPQSPSKRLGIHKWNTPNNHGKKEKDVCTMRLKYNPLAQNNKLSQILHSKLTQVIQQPTRITPTSAKHIDVIISNTPETITHTDISPISFSNYEPISVTINISKDKRPPIIKTYWDKRHYTSDSLRTHILAKTYSLHKIIQTDKTDTQEDLVTSLLTKCLDPRYSIGGPRSGSGPSECCSWTPGPRKRKI